REDCGGSVTIVTSDTRSVCPRRPSLAVVEPADENPEGSRRRLHRQDVAGRVEQYPLRVRPEQQLPDRTTPTQSDHDELGVGLGRRPHDVVRDVTPAGGAADLERQTGPLQARTNRARPCFDLVLRLGPEPAL